MQDEKNIAFFMKAKYIPKAVYNHRERELLSAIEACKEYKMIMLSHPIIVFIDHKNNTFNGLKASDRVLCTCWLLLLEEYGVTFEYLPGKRKRCSGCFIPS
jgi:hypothetical protein